MTRAHEAAEAYAAELEAEVEKLLADDAYMQGVAAQAERKLKWQEARNVWK